MFRWWEIVLSAGLAGLAILLLVLSFLVEAKAHMAQTGWAYPGECCSDKDCDEIPDSAVSFTALGYVINLGPDDHKELKRVNRRYQVTIPYSAARDAPDGRYHICLQVYVNHVKHSCFYAPPMGA